MKKRTSVKDRTNRRRKKRVQEKVAIMYLVPLDYKSQPSQKHPAE